ncbi:MAG TPA: DUF2786 domain-containing protein [Acidimicrobiia bacterium]|nr:DUF2786 domain-containing protein [Acidimicrobiia bacterium]
MGRNNRARRRAKQNRRRQSRVVRDEGLDRNERLSVEESVAAAVNAIDGSERARHIAQLGRLPTGEVAVCLARRLETAVAELWDNGWQPADVGRIVAKELGKEEALVARTALAAQACTYDQLGRAVAPEWMEQLDSLEAQRWWGPERPWLEQIGGDWVATIDAACKLLFLFPLLPDLPLLFPPPSRWKTMGRRRRTVPAERIEPRVLERIRALLAKAESTQFDAEAEAFTAKAQEMMTRHRIDRATVAAEGGDDSEVIGRRLGIDDPYAKAKAALVGGIARANACRAVYSPGLGFCTVFGMPEDVDGVEELYTSLLVQATAAVQREGSRIDHGGRSRTTRFRRSFYFGFAARIGQRLQKATDETVHQAEEEKGVALVPLMAAREQAAERAMREKMSAARAMSVAVSDVEGYYRGVEAADAARLDGVSGRITA